MKSTKRYDEANLHIAFYNSKGVIYDAPSNTLYRVSEETAKKLLEMQQGSYDHFATQIDSLFVKRETTTLHHSCWWNEKRITKLTFNITSRCNLRCKYCYANYGEYSGYETHDLQPPEAITCISELIKMGVNHIGTVQFFGGEPLLGIQTISAICCYFQDLYIAKQLDCVPTYTMITNCVALSNYAIDVIKKYNIKLTVSLDGPPHIHNAQRVFENGVGSYDCVSANLKKIRSQVLALEATYTNNHVLNNMSYEDLEHFFLDTFGITKEKISIVPVTGMPSLEVAPSKLHTMSNGYELTSDDTYLMAAINKEMQSDLFCTTGYRSLCIMPNGDIYPCHMYASERKYCLGNIYNGLDPTVMSAQLKRLPLGDKNNQNCAMCWARKICHICPAKTVISDQKEEDIVNPASCGRRRKMFERKLLQLVYSGEHHE